MNPRARITAAIITLNEELNIGRCLDSVQWCDQILVVDSFSTDRTVEICRARGARVVQRKWNGINEQRQFCLSQIDTEWVLALDADERATPELRAEIEGLLNTTPDHDGFLIPRHTFYLGRWINHGGWYPDYKLRCFRRERGRYCGHDPHDHCVIDGPPGKFRGEIQHYTYRSYAAQLRQINSFSDTAAADWLRAGHRYTFWRLMLRPMGKFLETYLLKRGFLDGLPGLVIAISSAFYMFVKYVKLWEQSRKIRSTDTEPIVDPVPSPATPPATSTPTATGGSAGA